MKEQFWTCHVFKKQNCKYNSYKGNLGKIVKNQLNRRFQIDRPYQNPSQILTNLGMDKRIYLEPIISAHPTLESALKPLNKALTNWPKLPYRTIIYTDQGVQYQNKR